MTMRFHLLGSVHESETLQYIAGEKTRNNRPISWTSPPNFLQLNPCPNSWMTFTTPSAIHRYTTVWKLKNSWYDGSLLRKVSKCVVTSRMAASMTMQASVKNQIEKKNPKYLTIRPSSLSGSKSGTRM